MRFSNYFLPTLKENPVDAKIVSHQLMLRAGLIRQTNSGIYSWLPLGLKILRNIENIIRQEINKAGCLEVLMPSIQPADLWLESGRYDGYGKEMLRIKDRHDRDMLFGPTCEEVITDIFRKNVTSYKDLPKNFYQISWKFRDEIRPRFGVMRGREFLMKDGYSFDLSFEEAKKTYNSIYETYLKIFAKMGLAAIAVKADTGAIGGDLSHEFHILAGTGESEIYYDKKLDELVGKVGQKDFDVLELQKLYSAADEMHDPKNCPLPKEQISQRRGIEVGHIFHFGEKYSKALGAKVKNSEGKDIYPLMGSYGIGVSRLVAAIIEASHDERGIIWPKEVAPFNVVLINLRSGDAKCDAACEKIYTNLLEKNVSVLFDDRRVSGGQKFGDADLIGIPTQIIIGPRVLKEGKMEIKARGNATSRRVDLYQFQFLNIF